MSSKYAIDERVRKVLVGGEVHEIVEELVEFPKGEAIVELRDADTGKLTHYEKSSNFIAPQWAITSRSYQRLAWDTWVFTSGRGIDVPVEAGYPVFDFPNQAIACWYDDSTESPSTEHTIHTGPYGVVAWAGRLPVGSPSGARGAINVSTSTRDITGESLVYDWPNTSGNGTFRSIGYTTMYTGTGIGYSVPLIRPKPSARHYLYTAGSAATVLGALSGTPTPGQPNIDTSGNLIVPFASTSGSSRAVSWFTVPSATWDQAWTYDVTGAAEDALGSATQNKAITGNSGSYVNCLGSTAGYLWWGYYATGDVARFGRMDLTTFAVDKVVSLPASTFYPTTGDMIGNDLYCTHGNTGADYNKVYRYDTTATPPSLTATITLDVPSWFSSSTHRIQTLLTDGTDLWAHFTGSGLGGWFKFNTSGDRLAHLGTLGSFSVETGSSPFAGTRYNGGLGIWQDMYYQRPYGASDYGWEHDQDTSYGSYMTSTLGCGNEPRLSFFENGFIQGGNASALGSPIDRVVFSFAELGHNLGSRVLLGSDTTKTSSNTMKITYNVTLPDFIP